MNHADHVDLIRDGVAGAGHVWADLGSGRGAFTLALAECLGSAGEIHSVDRDRGALRTQAEAMKVNFPETTLVQYAEDFTRPIAMPPLDGVMAANALHFVDDKQPVIERIHDMLKPGGRLIVIEYGTDRGNTWVPYPLSFKSFEQLAERGGFVDVRCLHVRPSRFLGEIYAAVAFRS